MTATREALPSGSTVSVYTASQLAAAVGNSTVSTVVLQRSFALTTSLALSGRALTVVGNTSGCFDASISPPPPPPPVPPPPAPPPPSPPGAPPPSFVVAASVTLQGYTASTLNRTQFAAGVAATVPAGGTVAVTNVTDVSSLRRRQLLAAGVAVNFTVTTTAANATTAALSAPTALLTQLQSAGLSGATNLTVVALASAPAPAGGGPPGDPNQPGPVPPGRRRLLATATAANTGSAAASAPLDGRCTLVLSASARARHFTLAGANLTLQSVSLTGGYFNDTTSGQAPQQTYALAISSPGDPAAAGGGAVFADANSWVVANDTSLSYNTGYPRGGALCSLNIASDAVTLTSCSLNGNALLPQAYNGIPTVSKYLYGGAIYAKGGVTLTDCELSGNYVPKVGGVMSNGGAILAPEVTLVGCTLQNNFVRGMGGAVALVGCSAYAGSECAASITDSDLSYNAADMGGALSSDVTSGSSYVTRVTISNSSFTSNTAGASGGSNVYGGAICLVSASVDIDGSTFSDNAVINGDAGTGGAVYVGPLLTLIGGIIPLLNVTVTSSTFTGNSASGAGGAMYLQTASKYMQGSQPADWSLVSLIDTLLDSNYAGISGGAMFLSCADVSLTRVTCTNNVADADNGGCAAVSTGKYVTLSQPLDGLGGFAVADSTLAFNSAVSGGALALGCSRQTGDSTLQSYYLNGGGACNLTLSVSNSSLVSNVASAQGGAVYNLAGGSLVLSAGTVLQNNTATGMSAGGGAVFQADYNNPFTSPALVLDAAELSENSVSLVASSLLPGETATSNFGAGLGGAVNIAVSTTTGASMRISDGTTLWGNSAVSGGAVFAYGSLTISATSSAFTGNVASDRGGALLLQSSTSSTSVVSASLVNVTMTGNSAYRGGAVALNAGSTLSASGGAFTENSASLGGGVFFLQTGTLTSPVVTLSGGCNASGNEAYAGGLAFTDAIISIDPPSFDSSCSVSGNAVVSMAPLIASPPVRFEVDAPTLMRTGDSIGVAATLFDAFNNTALLWPRVTATVAALDSTVLSGPALTGYANGAAVFNSTTLRGPVGSTYQLTVVLASSDLLDIVTSQVGNVNVTIAPCAANEEFQETSSLCVCSAGYAPTISSGCVACAPGTYAPAAGSSRCSVCATGAVSGDAATSCTSCPANSVVAANQCACAVGYYDANFGASTVAPLCTECPLGAVCTTGTLGAAKGFWREALNDTVFLACREGNCLEEEVTGPLSAQSGVTDNTTASRRRALAVNESVAAEWPATNCVEGNTGPMCGLCVPGYTLQSGVCAPCSPSDAFDAWSTGSKAGLLVGCIVFAVIVLAVAVFQPIAPAVENGLAATVSGAQAAKSRLVACITCACCRSSADAKAKSKIPPSPCCSEDEAPVTMLHEPAAPLPASEHAAVAHEDAHKAAHHPPTHHVAEAAHAAAMAHTQAAHMAHGFGLMAMANAAAAAGGGAEGSGDGNDGNSSGGGIEDTLDLMDELEELAGKLQRVSKILLNFYQARPAIVSTFLKSLDIPWPSIFGTIMARVSVVNLNLVQLPKTACLNPNPSFYSQFNGYTLGLVAAMLSAVALHQFGTQVLSRFTLRNMPAAERAERLAQFHSTVLARTLLVLYVIYPGVSVAIFSIFSCTRLNSGRAFLDADLAITCYDTLHWRYIAAGVAWLFVVPVGVPVFFLWLLRRYHVPKLAALMIDNAWLCEAAEHAWTLGLSQTGVVMKQLNVDTVTDRHLEALYALLLRDATAEEAADILSGIAPPLADEAEAEDAEQPTGLKARAAAAAAAAAERVKSFGASCTRSSRAKTEDVPDLQAARRQLLLEQLLAWCRTSGVISLPVIRWDDVEDEAEEEEASVDTGYTAPSPSGRIACRDMPRLQALALKEVGFLIAIYRVDCWHWESVELMRKLLLTSILALIAPGSAGQVVVGFILAFVMLMANLRIRPFGEDNLNDINALAQLNLCAFLFVALLLKVDMDGENKSAFFSFVVGALSVIPVVLPVLIKVWLKLYGSLDARMAVKDASWE